MSNDLAYLTATELIASYAKRELSPVEATQAALDRVDAVNEAVNAFCLVDADRAMASARESEKRWQRGEPVGLVDGVPTSIKDLFLTRGWPTLRGSRTVDPDQKWSVDSPCVARLRESGAVLLGKTTTSEFGWRAVTDNALTGVTRNPWDPARTPGGSSGGSAAAVALGMGPLSVGSDDGGSVRIPAAFCGIFGIKPTYGRIPLYPSLLGTFSHAGPMTRTVDDAALLLDVVTAPDSRDWSALAPPVESYLAALDAGVRGRRIAFSADLGYVPVDPEVAALVRAAVAAFGELDAVVAEEHPGFTDPIDACAVLYNSVAAKVVEPLPEHVWELLDPDLEEICRQGAMYSALDYLEATAQQMDLGVRMGAFHERYDLLVTPTVPIPAFAVGVNAPDGWDKSRLPSWFPFTYPFNLTQQPAATVPCGFTSAGLPVGLQIVGARHADALVMAAAKAFQEAWPWQDRRPTL